MQKIDLRSDTLTIPSPDMVQAMARANVGDDAFGEDRQVNELQEYCAAYFGKPAAIFMPSGTMSNQVALRALTLPGDEVICDATYHINFFESAQACDLGRVTLNPVVTPDGILTVEKLEEAVTAKARWSDTYALPKLVWLENSISTHGGTIFPIDKMEDVSSWCKNNRLAIFLDGARLLHSCIATRTNPRDYGQLVDAVTMCFSKGLGSPFGAILVGEIDFIARARRFRKWFGGGLHQSGYMAAAALYAMTNNVDMLFEDHSNAALLGELLADERLFRVKKVETNMVMFDVTSVGISAEVFVNRAAQEGVLLMVWRGNEVRAVTSSLVCRRDMYAAGKKLTQIAKSSLLTLAS